MSEDGCYCRIDLYLMGFVESQGYHRPRGSPLPRDADAARDAKCSDPGVSLKQVDVDAEQCKCHYTKNSTI